MKWVLHLTIAVLLATTWVIAQDQPALPATQLDVNALRVVQLEQQLVDTRALLLRKDIDLSTCRATIDSVTLSDRAKDLVEDFKRIYGGAWTWSVEQNRPVRPAPKEQ